MDVGTNVLNFPNNRNCLHYAPIKKQKKQGGGNSIKTPQKRLTNMNIKNTTESMMD